MTTPAPSDKPRTATEMVEGVVDTVSREASEKAAAVRNLYDEHIYGKQANATREMAKKASKWTWGKGGSQIISEETATKTIPFITGAIATGVGMLVLEPAKWVMEKTFGLLKNIVTGFGLLPKIPIIGKVFEWLGDGLETIGKYAGYAVPAIAGLIGYSMFDASRAPPREEIAKTGRGGTGAVATPADTTTVTVTNPDTKEVIASAAVPIAAATIAPLPDAVSKKAATVSVTKTTPISQVAEKREAAIAANNIELDKALEAYILHYNKNYENTRDMVKKTNDFVADNGSRGRLVEAVKALGLTEEQAQQFVPTPPDLKPTIYANGKDFPEDLVTFAKKFEAAYYDSYKEITHKTPEGREAPIFHLGGQKPGEKFLHWDEMTVTQREEFLGKAISHVKHRFAEFEKMKRQEVIASEMHASTFSYYDYKVGNLTFGQKFRMMFGADDPRATGRTYSKIDWPTEHAFIKDAYDIQYKTSHYMFGSDSSYQVGDRFELMLKDWQQQNADSDKHKGELQVARETTLRTFSDDVQQMETSLTKLKKGTLSIDDIKQQLEAKKTPPSADVTPAPARSSAAEELLAQTCEEARDVSTPALPGGKRSEVGAGMTQP